MARQKKEGAAPDGAESFEERFARLQEIVQALESGNPPLDVGVALFKEGVAISTACREQLDKARHEITLLTQNGPVPFEQEVNEEDNER